MIIEIFKEFGGLFSEFWREDKIIFSVISILPAFILYFLISGHTNPNKIFIANIISIIVACVFICLYILVFLKVGVTGSDWFGPFFVPILWTFISLLLLFFAWILYFVISYFAKWNFLGWNHIYGFYAVVACLSVLLIQTLLGNLK